MYLLTATKIYRQGCLIYAKANARYKLVDWKRIETFLLRVLNNCPNLMHRNELFAKQIRCSLAVENLQFLKTAARIFIAHLCNKQTKTDLFHGELRAFVCVPVTVRLQNG